MEKRVKEEKSILEQRQNVAYALTNFFTVGSSKEKTAKALSISRKTMLSLEQNGIFPKNRKVIKSVGLNQEELDARNLRETLEKIKQMTILKEELYQRFLELDINSTSKAYEWIDKIDKAMKDEHSLEAHMELLKESLPKLMHAYWSEKELVLETNYYKTEEDMYCIEVKFPKWVETVIGMPLCFEWELGLKEEEGSDEWENEIKDELNFYIMQELETIKKEQFNDKENNLHTLANVLIDDIIERFEYDQNMSWGNFNEMILMSKLDLPLTYNMANVILLGSLMLEGRTEEAMNILETSNVPKELYEEYALERFEN